jgi:hypothetical protein
MVQIPLRSGAYTSQSYIADSQRSINLYSEKNPEDSPFPITQLARPGLKLLKSAPMAMATRCLYRSTTGFLFAVLGQNVYYIDANYVFTQIGATQANLSTPAYMADNGTSAFLVDGSPQGYIITLPTTSHPVPTMIQSADPNFFGSNRVDFIDTFLIFNVPGTNQWYCTLSDDTAFNALFIGVKTAWPDPIQCVVAIERVVYVFGTQKSEAWYNAGTVPFPFQIQPGVIIEQGCVARYSPQKMNQNIYWLSQSPEGARIVMTGDQQLVAKRISTHAIEHEFLTYTKVDDAIGSVYQIEGHLFYELHFPTADKTWTFDAATEQWFEDNWIDNNGVLHRARNTFTAYCYGLNLAMDWANGNLYQIDQSTFTDNGQVIPWIRSFPHVQDELKRLMLTSIKADVETGTRPGTGEGGTFGSPWSAGFSSGFGPLNQIVQSPTIALRISRNGGNTYDNNRLKSFIGSGRYRAVVRWRGNGYARDWVIELSSTAEMSGALNGAYVEPLVGED